ncbi:hypothetical protein SeMB42_g01236 [Synchytrium endobioticum]|uniref:Pre-mRNA processing factor 4 (PRP4)-like domain-containing protein n=1 Tax=Synchytrium endobioticum TaxID=286115 RepID=A0A507DND0_9FUNG|nr:hypothetical protein SeLEV6574_g00704 [Synchytrium endobioticum]TPX52697.1 hypothetical protein SeMB42_g01236 [Synchytrium endobioticum]
MQPNFADGRRFHFGSLEGNPLLYQQQQHLHQQHAASNQHYGVTYDQLHSSAAAIDDDEDMLDIQDISTTRAKADHKAILDEFERRKVASSLAVPTDDKRVRARLREFGDPMTLFGEGPAERRDRLRFIMSQRYHQDIEDEAAERASEAGSETDESGADDDEDGLPPEKRDFFYPGSDDIREVRKAIADFSLPRAERRVAQQLAELDIPMPQRKMIRHEWYTHLKSYTTLSSQFGDDRPTSTCTFAPDSKSLATASFSGLLKLWDVPSCKALMTYRGHTERVGTIAFHPDMKTNLESDHVAFASGASDGSLNLFALSKDTPVACFDGHLIRITRVAFHPSGRYLASASYDQTWRLWDVSTQKELLLQEGHYREVYGLVFQNDGALLATGGSDAHGRIWDLRTGRCIMSLSGHVQGITSMDWSRNGYTIASGSLDNSVRIWDVRKGESVYMIPAHKNVVSSVKFFNASDDFDFRPVGIAGAGNAMSIDSDHVPASVGIRDAVVRRRLLSSSFLVSCSFDGTTKLWTEGDWKPLRSLVGQESKVMCCDVSRDGQYIATASYDRTFKLYSPEGQA